MKKLNKILALVLTLALVMSLGITAFAEGETPAPQTVIKKAENDAHSYKIYQIFTGDVSGSTLSNIKWGKNGTGTEKETVSDEVLENIMKVAGSGNSDLERLNVIQGYCKLDSEAAYSLSKDEDSVEVAPGYYIIVDTTVIKDGTVPSDAKNLNVVAVVGNITITKKTGAPSSEKKVKDINDSEKNATHTDWQDSADYDIGDEVPFQISATVPADTMNHFNTYPLTFHDKQSEGLTFKPGTVAVYVNGGNDPIAKDKYSVEVDDLTDGCTFHVVITNLKECVENDSAATTVSVEYMSELNDLAVIGSAGNPNEMRLEYRNNPNIEHTETSKTPWDKVIVFTYKTVVNKVDGDKNPLAGAGFTLYKMDPAATGDAVAVMGSDGNPYKVVGTFETDDTTTKFGFKGLDDGNYLLRETTTPAGYNTAEDIYFTISAEHNVKSDNPQLLTFSGDATSGSATFASDKDNGTVSTDVVNNKGIELPSTGGIGTTIFYTVGSILMLAAAVLLITRKKMSAYQD